MTYKTRQDLEDDKQWKVRALSSLTKDDRRFMRKNKKKRNRKKS